MELFDAVRHSPLGTRDELLATIIAQDARVFKTCSLKISTSKRARVTVRRTNDPPLCVFCKYAFANEPIRAVAAGGMVDEDRYVEMDELTDPPSARREQRKD
jgi:hypothetical protein